MSDLKRRIVPGGPIRLTEDDIDDDDGAVWVRVNAHHPSSVIPQIVAHLLPLDPEDRHRVVAWLAHEYLLGERDV